jgi:hypothetical protein
LVCHLIGCHFLGTQVNGSVLPASVISLYCMYLCYSGLSSEPREYECNGLHRHSKAVSTSTLTIGLLTTVLSVVYSAVRAGSSTTLLSPPSSPRAGKSLANISDFWYVVYIWYLKNLFRNLLNKNVSSPESFQNLIYYVRSNMR